MCHIIGHAKEERRIWQGNREWSIPGRFILLRQRLRRTSHVTCRMVEDAPSPGSYGDIGWAPERRLFRDEADHERFLERISERVEQFHILLSLFVLMTSHFHLVFETPAANCSKFIRNRRAALGAPGSGHGSTNFIRNVSRRMPGQRMYRSDILPSHCL